MTGKRLFAGILAAMLAAGAPAVYGAGDSADNAERTPAAVYFDLTPGGSVSLQIRDSEELIHETVLSVEGEQTVVSEQILREDGTSADEPEVRTETYDDCTYCLETDEGQEIALRAAAVDGYEVTACDLTDRDGHTESIKEQLDTGTLFVQAGKTDRIRIVFSAREAGTADHNDSEEMSASAQDTADQPEVTAEDHPDESVEDGSLSSNAGEQEAAEDNPGGDSQEKTAVLQPDEKTAKDQNLPAGETISGDDVTKQDAAQKLTDAVIEQYLLDHVDETYTKKDFLQVVNLMNAQQTLFSGAHLPAGTSLDQAMKEDRYLDHWLGSYRYIVPVYWMSESSDYYVAFLNTMQNDANASVRDVSFAENNTAGHALSGCIYDGQTGIVYIPANLYQTQGESDALQIGVVQAQLLQAVSGTSDGTEASSVCEVLTSRSRTLETETVAEPMLALETTVQTAAGMNPDKLHVAVNGLPLTEDYYHYNGQTGALQIAMSSAAVASVDVTEEKTGILEKLADAVGARTVHAVSESEMPNVYKNLKLKLPSYVQEGMYLQGNIIDTMMSNGTDAYNELKNSREGAPNVYAYEYTHGHLDYAWDEKNSDGSFKHAAGELIDLIYNGERKETVSGETVTRKLKYSKLSMFTDAWWQVLNFSHDDSGKMNVYTAAGKKTDDAKVSLSALGNIPLTCSHITCPLGNISSGVQDPDEDDLDSGAVNLKVKVRVRVFERNEAEGYAVLGVLAAHHKVGEGEADNGQTGVAVFKVAIEPTTAKISIRKQSASPEISEQNGMYSLADAVYTIYRDEACTKKADEFRTNAAGVSNTVTLQIGTSYWYKETTAPKGFYPDAQVRKISLDGTEAEHVEIVSDAPKEAVPEMLVYKLDSETGEAKPQGDASLEGAVFTVRHFGAQSASGTPLHTWTFRTDTAGKIVFDAGHLVSGTLLKNSAGKITFPLGTYTFEETGTPEGYLPIGKTFTVSLLENGDGVRWSDESFVKAGFRAEEPVIHGSVQVTKQDIELNRAEAIAGGDLSGIRFEVINASRESVMFQGKRYAPGETVVTLETDQEGNAATEDKTLPYGTYQVRELPSDKQKKSANDSYLFTEKEQRQAEIRKDGENVPLTFKDQIKRSDLEFRKVDDQNDQGLPHIPFVLEQVESGERHVILTDKNGRYSTEKYAHSLETNKLDGLLNDYTDETVIPDQLLADYEFGTWFGKSRQGTDAPVNDQLSALPYGNYVMNELRCEANQNYKLIENYAFTIEEDGEQFDFNNLRNRIGQISIGTTLKDDGTGAHNTSLGADGMIHLTDTVACRNLKVGETYLLQAKLMERESEDVFRAENADGMKTPVKGELSFTAERTSMEVDVPLSAFAPPADALQVVAFERLYLLTEDGKRGQHLASHEDISDTEQTVQIPSIHTAAADRETGNNTGTVSETQTITDTVSYSGLIPDQSYEMRGKLIDRETGKEILTGGSVVESRKEFTPQEPGGTVQLDFKLDSRNLAGKTVVVFEELYLIQKQDNPEDASEEDQNNETTEILTAVHKDPEDAAQSVTYPEPAPEPAPSPEPTPGEKRKPKKITPVPTSEPGKTVTTPGTGITRKGTPVTGDPARIALFACLCTAAACGIGILLHIILHRKRR